MTDLAQFAAELHAAAKGAAEIATSAIASAKAEAATGAQFGSAPGPALQTIIARQTGSATGNTVNVGASSVQQISDHMAENIANQAVKVLVGT